MASAEHLDITQTHPYTCNSCAVAFRNSDAQRTHMRSDWHRYNLKRKIAELPPVSSEDYNEKVLAAQATNTAAAEQAAFAKTCSVCQKAYYSENAYQNHIGSKAHRIRAKAQRKAGDTASIISSIISTGQSLTTSESRDPEAEEEFDRVVEGIKSTTLDEGSQPSVRPGAPAPDTKPRKDHPLSPDHAQPEIIPLSRCLFCNYESPSLKLNVTHMSKIHGLFIPEQSYLTDVDGLLEYLQAKIHLNHECLSCHKLKSTVDGVQTHMRDKGHCRIAFETEEEMIEIGQFYDFSSTYSDPEVEDSDTEMTESKEKVNGGVKLPGRGAGDDAEDGWETDSSFSSLDSAELTSVPMDDRTESYGRLHLHRHHSHRDPRPHRNADGFHSHAHNHNNAVFYDDYEMHLPSGRVAGHRSLKKYYRQNLHSYPSMAERMERAQRLIEEGSGDDEEMLDEEPPTTPRTRALTTRGEAGMIGATNSQRKEVRSQEIRSRQKEQRAQNRYQAKLEKQNNFQKHFRDPLLQ